MVALVRVVALNVAVLVTLALTSRVVPVLPHLLLNQLRHQLQLLDQINQLLHHKQLLVLVVPLVGVVTELVLALEMSPPSTTNGVTVEHAGFMRQVVEVLLVNPGVLVVVWLLPQLQP